MKKIKIKIEYPLQNCLNSNLCHIYLGGKDLHDIPIDEEVNLLLELLFKLKDKNENIMFARLDAEDNELFTNFLIDKRIDHKRINGELSKLNIKKRFFKHVLPNYQQPWVFFEADNFEDIENIMKKYWICYGGFWVFLFYIERFNINIWENEKKMMKYDIWEFAKNQASYLNKLILISEDYIIELFLNKPFVSKKLKAIIDTVLKNKFGISTL